MILHRSFFKLLIVSNINSHHTIIWLQGYRVASKGLGCGLWERPWPRHISMVSPLYKSLLVSYYGIMAVTGLAFIVGLSAWCLVLLWMRLGFGVPILS